MLMVLVAIDDKERVPPTQPFDNLLVAEGSSLSEADGQLRASTAASAHHVGHLDRVEAFERLLQEQVSLFRCPVSQNRWRDQRNSRGSCHVEHVADEDPVQRPTKAV